MPLSWHGGNRTGNALCSGALAPPADALPAGSGVSWTRDAFSVREVRSEGRDPSRGVPGDLVRDFPLAQRFAPRDRAGDDLGLLRRADTGAVLWIPPRLRARSEVARHRAPAN